ncbi:hypothetical protein HHI36_018111 [Cryptolaemus montrouzieri]|uniref:DUF1963 domain-containing protein n=1 Tax=Cryptolaemus montrouzieri TaxID=559131 RepID=A0ABD2NZE8_9CUCU
MESLEIPEKFVQYAKEIKATIKNTVRFKLKPAIDLKIWQSKVGGIPYLPIEENYPCNDEQIPLQFLIQINFSEIPHLPGFPEKGILEFYVDSGDDLLGLDFNKPTHQNGFRVLYFNNVDEDESKLQKDVKTSVNEGKDYYGPISKGSEYSIEFFLEKQYISGYDYRFPDLFCFASDDDMLDEYNDIFPPNGHRLGGYAYFTQSDPREEQQDLQEYELLLQLDTDHSEGCDIMWGDTGVGAFFIKPDDLVKCDFSNVLYNWNSC